MNPAANIPVASEDELDIKVSGVLEFWLPVVSTIDWPCVKGVVDGVIVKFSLGWGLLPFKLASLLKPEIDEEVADETSPSDDLEVLYAGNTDEHCELGRGCKTGFEGVPDEVKLVIEAVAGFDNEDEEAVPVTILIEVVLIDNDGDEETTPEVCVPDAT